MALNRTLRVCVKRFMHESLTWTVNLAPSPYLRVLLSDKFTKLILISPSAYSETGCVMVPHCTVRHLGKLWRSVPQTMENDRPKFLVTSRYILLFFFLPIKRPVKSQAFGKQLLLWGNMAAIRKCGGSGQMIREGLETHPRPVTLIWNTHCDLIPFRHTFCIIKIIYTREIYVYHMYYRVGGFGEKIYRFCI